jgi:hypothetical protein
LLIGNEQGIRFLGGDHPAKIEDDRVDHREPVRCRSGIGYTLLSSGCGLADRMNSETIWWASSSVNCSGGCLQIR